MKCGICGSNIVINSGKYPNGRYSCSYHRKRGVCSNSLTILQSYLEEQLLGRIVHQLSAPEFQEEMQTEFRRQVAAALKEESRTSEEISQRRSELRKEQVDLRKRIGNLTMALADGYSPSLRSTLDQFEARYKAIEDMLAASQQPPAPQYDAAELDRFVTHHLKNLIDLLNGDSATTKQELLKRIDQLILTPEERDGEDIFVVSGDLALFAPDDAMLCKSLKQHKGVDSVNSSAIFHRSALNWSMSLKWSAVILGFSVSQHWHDSLKLS